MKINETNLFITPEKIPCHPRALKGTSSLRKSRHNAGYIVRIDCRNSGSFVIIGREVSRLFVVLHQLGLATDVT